MVEAEHYVIKCQYMFTSLISYVIQSGLDPEAGPPPGGLNAAIHHIATV